MNFSLRKRILHVIGVDGFSKQWGVFFASDHDLILLRVTGMNMDSTA